jgi:DNA-binding NtrC family response regulator
MNGKSRGWILIMDDDEGIRVFAGTVAAMLGYDVILAADGDEAVTFFREARDSGRPFDAVILDLVVPNGMGAVNVIGELRSLDPTVRAVISTGNVEHPAFTTYWKYGFSGALGKPYRLKNFSDTLAAMVEKKPRVAADGRHSRPRTAPALQRMCC